MKQLLVYGDSLSWGLIPGTRNRLTFKQRWPGVLEGLLSSTGQAVRVNENSLNGRRTVWPDPFKPGRNGSRGLAQVIEMHSPLDLVILMLGVNDFQSAHANTPALSAMGVARLVEIIRQAPVEPGMPVPEILVISPPEIRQARGDIADKFTGAAGRGAGLAASMQSMALAQAVYFFDSALVIHTSEADGVHLEQDQHQLLGEAVARYIEQTVW